MPKTITNHSLNKINKSLRSDFIYQFFLIMVAIAILHCDSYAQVSSSNDFVKGTILDSLTKLPIPFATVQLMEKKNQMVINTLANEQGQFNREIEVDHNKFYSMSVSAVGYKTKNIDLKFDNSGRVIALKKILLQTDHKLLDQVDVKAMIKRTTQKVDRLVYNVQADPLSKFLDIWELLKRVPLLNIDGDGTLKLLGNANYQIQIDSKPTALLVRNPKDVLSTIPASKIKSIEVITTPSAKYDSEGFSGIINIVTLKQIDDRIDGSINIAYQGPAAGPSIGNTLSLKYRKFSAATFFGYSRRKLPQTKSYLVRYFDLDSLTQNQESYGGNNSKTGYGGGQLSYEVDSLNLLTANFSYNREHIEAYSNQQNWINNTNDIEIQDYSTASTSGNVWDAIDFGINYQRMFKRNRDEMLTLSYKFSNNKEVQSNSVNVLQNIGYPSNGYTQNNRLTQKENTIQVDYIKPFKVIKMEAGVKAIIRDGGSKFDDLTALNTLDQVNIDKLQNAQSIYGLYNSYNFQKGSWSLIAGGRLEATFTDNQFYTTDSRIRNHYTNFIPSLIANYNIDSTQSFNVGYTQRIQRPNIRTLNPFINRLNATTEETGNPNLKAVINNVINLRYMKNSKYSLVIDLGYSFASNTIEQTLANTDSIGTSRLTYNNIGKNSNVACNFAFNYPFNQSFSMSLSGSLAYINLEGTVNTTRIENSGEKFYLSTSIDYLTKSRWQISGNYRYNSPDIILQGKTNAVSGYSLSSYRSIFHDKITLSFLLSNIFSKYRNARSNLRDSEFNQYSQSQVYYRTASISIGYKFGHLKDNVKNTAKTINNDDAVK